MHACPARDLCPAKADGRREIERSEFAKAVEENRHRYCNNKDAANFLQVMLAAYT
jgi:hypothetical protein